MKNLKYLLIKIIILHGICSFAQSSDVYTWFDQEVGYESSGLFNGIEFINRYNPIDDKHRFFETSSFTNGEVVYGNQIFYNVALRYDLFEDQLVVKIETEKGTNQILLLKEKIESFNLGKNQFKNVKKSETNNTVSPGFYQILTQNENFILYKRNHKKIDKGIKNRVVYYEFNEIKPVYIIKTKSEYFEVKRKRDLTSKYPDLKSEISNFKWSSEDFKSNDNQLILTINKLDQILNN